MILLSFESIVTSVKKQVDVHSYSHKGLIPLGGIKIRNRHKGMNKNSDKIYNKWI